MSLINAKRFLMLIKQNTNIIQFNFIKKHYTLLILLLCVSFICHSDSLYGSVQSNRQTYYLYISDFAESFIEIPINIPSGSSTISSKYLAGRAKLYDQANQKIGTCSASFLCMKNADGVYTDISNYISVDNGLIVTWFTPTTLIDLELDNIIHSMVTECIVMASTKVGFNPFYGQTFDLVVSSDDQKIYFQFTRTGAIF